MQDMLGKFGRFVGKGNFDPHTNKAVRTGEFPDGYPANMITLYSPDDDIPGALLAAIGSAQHSLVVAMYGFDDEVLARIIQRKMADPGMFVQLSLDSSQAGGVHERGLLDEMRYPANLVAYGRSERGAIMHMKMAVIDGRYTVTGSTNWSESGETKQDNQLTILDDPMVAARARTKIDLVHATMQQQMAKHATEDRKATHEAFLRSAKKYHP